MLSAVLDGYRGARLDRALTQGPDRVADSAGAGNGLSGRGPQLFVLDGVPAAGKTPEQVEAALRAEVARVARDGVSEAELARVKTQWVAGEVYKLDSVMSQARELGSNWVQGLPLDAGERLIARLRAVTAEQVQAVAGKLFRRRPAHRRHAAPAAARPEPQPPPARRARRRPALTERRSMLAMTNFKTLPPALVLACAPLLCWPCAGAGRAADPALDQPSGAQVYLVESHGHADGRRAGRLRRRRPARPGRARPAWPASPPA